MPAKNKSRVNPPRKSRRQVRLVTAVQAPAAVGNSAVGRAPVMKSQPDGSLLISHSERMSVLTIPKVSDTPAGGYVQSVALRPSSVPWLGGVAEHFQMFRWEAVRVRFVSEESTSVTCPIVMAPSYDYQPPLAGAVNGIFPIGELPGANQFAIWASNMIGTGAASATRLLGNKVGGVFGKTAGEAVGNAAGTVSFLASKFSRYLFRTVGFNVYLAADPTAGVGAMDEFNTPGHILVQSDNHESSALHGSLWIDYVARMVDPKPSLAPSLSVYSVSTSDSALALGSSVRQGTLGHYVLSGNTIKCLRPGRYAFSITQVGTDPIIATTAFTVKRLALTDITTSAFCARFDVSSNAFSAPANSSTNAIEVHSATADHFAAYINLEYGDVLTIPALTSGTITSTHVSLDYVGPSSHRITA